MKNLFPFKNIRPVQNELLRDVEEALKKGENLLAHAPTGLGKTAASMAPSLSYALENSKNIIFLTSRHSQHVIAIETLKKIKEKHGVNFNAVDIIGKKWLCPIKDIEKLSPLDFREYCRNLRKEERCPFYNNTYNKKRNLTEGALKKLESLKGKILHAEEVKRTCLDFCSYEILMSLAKDAQVLIGDYYHVLHPKIRKSLFSKLNKSEGDFILIIDEAHNLPERTRELLSSSLSQIQISKAKKEAKRFEYVELSKKLENLSDVLVELKKEKLKGTFESYISKQDLVEKISKFVEYKEFVQDLEELAVLVREEKRMSYSGGLAKFLEEWGKESKGYARILKKEKSKTGKPYLKVLYKCLDPQISTHEILNNVHSSILMSGTLTPLEMYQDLLGLEKNRTNLKAYKNPFPKENRLNLVVDKVTTRYSLRDENQFKKIAWFLSKSAEKVPGNIGVFFPSYKLRDKVFSILNGTLNKEILLEKRKMSKEEKKELFERFKELKEKGAVLLAVFRGSFDQGVDYPGNLLNAVFVVGLPLERPELEVRAMIDFYDYKFKKGWDYGYFYPAVNLALQAAGRCIRSKKDKGVAVFLDERYVWGQYRRIFPPEMELKITKKPWDEIERFYK